MIFKTSFQIVCVPNVQLPILETLKNVNVVHTLITFHGSFDPAFGITFANIGSAIVFLFSFAHSEFELHESPLTIQANWHQSQPFGPGFSDETGDIAPLQEELPRAGVFMGHFVTGMAVAGNEGISEVELIAVDGDEGTFEAGMARFDALYLGSGQDNTSLIVVLEAVVKPGSSVVSNRFTHMM